MPGPLSNDLRRRVVRFVEAGHSRHEAARHFGVSPSFVINLMTLFRLTGSVEPRPRGGFRHGKLGPHRAFILRQVADKGDITMPELAQALGLATGTRVDPATLSRWLIANGYRYKKNTSGQRTRQARHPRRAS